MYAHRNNIPETLGVGRSARNVRYREDTLDEWIAEVDEIPEGAVEIDAEDYSARAASIDAHNAALPPPPDPPSPPDVGGFLLALYASTADGGLGEDRAIALAQARPDFTLAMQRGRFDLARGIVERIRARNVITAAEHDAILAAFAAFHIPRGVTARR